MALPAAAIASRSVPRFITDPDRGFMVIPPSPRIYYTPFGELDWIDMPSDIVQLQRYTDTILFIECLDGDYALYHHGTPERNWRVQRVA